MSWRGCWRSTAASTSWSTMPGRPGPWRTHSERRAGSCTAVFLAGGAAVEHLMTRRAGCIVNISSMVGKEAIPFFVHYSASKFAVIGLTQGLAKEMAPYDVNVNAVCPGVVKTPLWEPLLDQLSATKGISRDEAFDEFVSGIPLGRPQEPEDIGEVVAFLASDRARNMTGQGVNVTGGMQLH